MTQASARGASALGSRIHALRADGLSITQTAATLAVSKSTVCRYLYPHLAERSRETSRNAKRRRLGICVDCGGETHYGGRESTGVSNRCMNCSNKHIALNRRGTGPRGQLVLAYCLEPRRHMEIARFLGISKNEVASLLDRLRRYGLLERPSRGVYVTASAGKKVLDREHLHSSKMKEKS